jgi:hypothetical protein
LIHVVACALPAQEPLITPATPIDDNILHQWLHSGDPRLIAWAADFARKTRNAKIVAEMPELLEHWAIPQVLGDTDSRAAQVSAISAILDTLIQENAQVPIPAINAIAEVLPAQAAILIARLPLSESRATLEDWTYGETGTWTGRTLARIASMMLAKDPVPSRTLVWDRDHPQVGFVASVVAASEEELAITVASSNAKHEGTASGVCGDYGPRKIAAGWPQIYTYDLVENDPQATTPVVIDLNGDRIVSRRFDENHPWGSCNHVRSLDPSTRHQLIAYWLGIPEKEMPWQPVESFTIVWTDKAAYERQLGEATEAQREKLRTTVEALRRRGLVTEDEAETVAPKLAVTVHCEIDPCPLL